MTLPSFGATVTNLLADHRSPHRRGYFVREVRRMGRGQTGQGRFWQLTDGQGTFWELHPTTGQLGMNDFDRELGRPAIEIDESTALPALRKARTR